MIDGMSVCIDVDELKPHFVVTWGGQSNGF